MICITGKNTREDKGCDIDSIRKLQKNMYTLESESNMNQKGQAQIQ